MADKIEIAVYPRETGKHNSRAFRRAGKIPAIIYGPKTTPHNLLADELAVRRYGGHKFESTIFTLKSDDAKLNKIAVLVRDVQVHPVTRNPIHVDFYAVDMSSTIKVKIEIRFVGKPIGLSEGGILDMIMRELEVECLPSDIPEFVEADVTNLGVGDALHVSDLRVPEKVRIVAAPSLTIATISVLKEEVVTPVATAATDATGAPAAGTTPAAPGAAPAAPGAAPAAAAPAAGGDKKKG